MGLVMAGSNLGFMIGPSIGGWLYETGGMQLPFLLVTALAAVGGGSASSGCGAAAPIAAREAVPFSRLIRVPAVAVCCHRGRRRVGDDGDVRAGAVALPVVGLEVCRPAVSGWCSVSRPSRRRCCIPCTAGSRIATAGAG